METTGEREPLRLFAGTRHIGYLEPDGADWPKVFAAFRETDAFGEFREFFQKQRVRGGTTAMWKEMDALDLRIVGPGEHEERLFMILIDGQRAMWRVGFLRATKIAAHEYFWGILGDEVGPEACSEPGCSRLKIRQSIFCKRHHFRMISGEHYEGAG